MNELIPASDRWRLVQADCIEHMPEMPAQSVDFAVFSPPFPSLFAYTSEASDIGNSENFRGDAKLHLRFFANQLVRVMKPGRVVAIHCQQIAGLKRNGEPSTIDFRGLLIRVEMIRRLRSRECDTITSKPRILGFGLNLQVVTRQVFSWLQDSYESFYQCVKRSNRIGSTKPLSVHIPVTELEEAMVSNVLRKASRVEADTREQEHLFREAMA